MFISARRCNFPQEYSSIVDGRGKSGDSGVIPSSFLCHRTEHPGVVDKDNCLKILLMQMSTCRLPSSSSIPFARIWNVGLYWSYTKTPSPWESSKTSSGTWLTNGRRLRVLFERQKLWRLVPASACYEWSGGRCRPFISVLVFDLILDVFLPNLGLSLLRGIGSLSASSFPSSRTVRGETLHANDVNRTGAWKIVSWHSHLSCFRSSSKHALTRFFTNLAWSSSDGQPTASACADDMASYYPSRLILNPSKVSSRTWFPRS